jgi:hypothetical protein
MKIWSIAAVVATALLSACGSLSNPSAPANESPVARSWMAPEAKSKTLLYISDLGTDDVYVYSYPDDTLVGTLSGFSSPVRECSDSTGNVFITNTDAEQVLEYAHGGSKPIATYDDKGFLPEDCSVDPVTKALAVTNYGPGGSNTGSLAIYKAGTKIPKIIHDNSLQAYLFCAYDGSGNLYVSALNDVYDFVLAELPKNAKKFVHIKLDQIFKTWGDVKWDGKYLAVGDGISTIYDFSIGGKHGTKVATIELKRAVNVLQFWIDGATVIAPDGPNGGHHDAGFWKYPGGGPPHGTVGIGLFKNPSAATISVAP